MRSSSISWPTNSPTSCSTRGGRTAWWRRWPSPSRWRSEEHTSELHSRSDLVCRLLLEKKKKKDNIISFVQANKNVPKQVHPPADADSNQVHHLVDSDVMINNFEYTAEDTSLLEISLCS